MTLQIKENTFIGSSNCIDCHKKEYEDWSESHHDWAMKEASNISVLADFSNTEITLDGIRYRFRNDSGLYWISVFEPTDMKSNAIEEKTYEIKYTFGVYPLQQYITEFPKGQYQVLRLSWDDVKKKWFHQYKGDQVMPDDWLHWTRGGQRWNTMCAECHSTNLKKNYNVKSRVFNTTFDEINVACESCHGPASQHAEYGNESTKSLFAGTTQTDQINMCGPCHARRTKLTKNMKVGAAFHDQFLVQNISSEFYHEDGQIREEDYVLGSFLQSKMYHNDVKCTDCHNPHTLELKFEGNRLCMQCHEPKYDSPEHHFHAQNTDGAKCVNCHMAGETYMGNDFRRDHSFRVPRPDQSVKYGTPNACMDCHKKQGNEWAAEAIVKWYGPNREKNYTDKLLVALNEDLDDKTYTSLLNFITSEKEPEIARATMMRYLPISYTEEEIYTLLQCLKSPSPIIRYHAIMEFEDLTTKERESIALKHINDESKLVRIGVSRIIAERDIEEFPVRERNALRRGRTELEEMLNANADFPMGRLQLGDYYMRKNQFVMAIHEYETALEMDDQLSLVHSNLATAYNLAGDNLKALQTLDRLLELEPEYDRGLYLRGLLLYEMGEKEKALNDIGKALELEPENQDYLRNYKNLVSEINS